MKSKRALTATGMSLLALGKPLVFGATTAIATGVLLLPTQTASAQSANEYLTKARSELEQYIKEAKSDKKKKERIIFLRENLYRINRIINDAKESASINKTSEAYLILGKAYLYKKNSHYWLNNPLVYKGPEYDEFHKIMRELETKALSSLDQAIQIDPKNIPSLLLRGNLLAEDENEKGIDDLTRVLVLDPSNLNALSSRSISYRAMGRDEYQYSLEQRVSYLELALKDKEKYFSIEVNPSPDDFLARGMIKIEMTKLIRDHNPKRSRELLIGACIDASTAWGKVRTFKLIWDMFEECKNQRFTF